MVLLSSGFTSISLLIDQAGPAAVGTYVGLPGLPALDGAGADELTRTARDFLRAFGATQPFERVETSALYAAQAADVVLDAIARSDGTRSSVLAVSDVRDGILGDFRFDANGDTTLAPVSVYRVASPGGSNEVMGVDGGVLEEVVVSAPELVG